MADPSDKDPRGKQEKPEKEVVKVVKEDGKKVKPSLGKRIRNIFITGDLSGAIRYVASDVLLPALRNLIVDSTTKGIERVIYGESRRASSRNADPRHRYYSYNNPIARDPRRTYDVTQSSPSRNRRPSSEEILLGSNEDAEIVLERLTDIVDKYDSASVADLHELVGLPTNYVDNDWGWTDLSEADIRQVREGFLLELPRIEEIG